MYKSLLDHDLYKTIPKFDPKTMPTSSISIVLAKRRGGKSTLVQDLVRKLFKAEKIDVALLFSGTDADFPDIKKEFRFNDIDKLKEVVERYRAMNEFNKIVDPANKFKVKTMIIVDDLVLKLKGKDFKILQELAVNGRHAAYHPLSLNIVILAQNLTSIPRLVRNNVDYIFFNNLSSQRELEIVLDENMYIVDSSREGKKEARKLYNDLVKSKDYAFIVIENYKQNIRDYKDYIKIYVATV